MASDALIQWLREVCSRYRLEPIAVFRRADHHPWPLIAVDNESLEAQLRAGGHLLSLPKEPAALANVLEVSLVDFMLQELDLLPGASGKRGSERGYPDLEIAAPAFGTGHHAVDVKVARRRNNKFTKSRITLFTGNSYFKYPELRWPGTSRPFVDYQSHLDVVAIYTLDVATEGRIKDLELLVQESWRIASRQRSSTTREYIGAVMQIGQLRQGLGEFSSEEEFLEYWRRFPFKIGRAVDQQLKKLLARRPATSS